MSAHSRIPDEGLKESVWWVGVTYGDRLRPQSVTTVARLRRAPEIGMKIVIRGKKVKIRDVKTVMSHRFDSIARVELVVDKTS